MVLSLIVLLIINGTVINGTVINRTVINGTVKQIIVLLIMKILHIGKYYFPYARGIETYLKNLCERLIEAVDLEVIVANDSLKTIREEINGVPVTRLGRLFELASTSFCTSLPFIIRKKKPDIVHIHLPNPWAELCYFLAGCPGKLVVSFHSDIIRQKFLLKLHSPLHKAFLKKAEKIIVATPRHAEFSPFLSKFLACVFSQIQATALIDVAGYLSPPLY